MAGRRVLLALLAVAPLAACEDFFRVESPVRVPARRLDDPALAPILVQGAIADFECAFSVYVALTGSMVDELASSTGSANLANDWDRRRPSRAAIDVAGCAVNRTGAAPTIGMWLPLSTARYQADDMYRRIAAFPDTAVPGKDTLLATLAAYAGYSYTLIGEGFCEGRFDGGQRLPPAQVLALAEQRFDTAIAHADSSPDILNMALVGRARVRLDLGKAAAADADARRVPPGYARYATYSSDTPRRENQVYMLSHGLLRVTVDPRYRALTVGGVPDPRVPVLDAGRNGDDLRTPLWLQLKYTSESSPIRIASWEEAHLIIAEAAGGQEAVNRINAVRAQYPGLPLFASTDATEILREVVRERRAALWLEGHRLNDRLRLRARLGVPATVSCPGCFTNAVEDSATLGLAWETGSTYRPVNPPQDYESMMCITLPNVEILNNP